MKDYKPNEHPKIIQELRNIYPSVLQATIEELEIFETRDYKYQDLVRTGEWVIQQQLEIDALRQASKDLGESTDDLDNEINLVNIKLVPSQTLYQQLKKKFDMRDVYYPELH